MKSISLINFKGGVTKTTSTVGLGSALASSGYRILLVDCDPQSHLALHLGINREEIELSLENVLASKGVKLSDIIIDTSQDNLFLAPSKRGLLNARTSLATRHNRDAVLTKAMRGLESYFDFVLIDTPPDESILSVNAMYACRYIIIPTPLDSLSLDGINPVLDAVCSLKEAYEEKKWDILGVLINRYDKRLSTENVKSDALLKEVFGQDGMIFETRIRVDEELRKALRLGRPVSQYNAKSKSANDFLQLAKEIVEKLQ